MLWEQVQRLKLAGDWHGILSLREEIADCVAPAEWRARMFDALGCAFKILGSGMSTIPAALQAYQQGLAANSPDATDQIILHLQIAGCHIYLGDFEKAESHLQAALERINVTDPEHLRLLGLTYQNYGVLQEIREKRASAAIYYKQSIEFLDRIAHHHLLSPVACLLNCGVRPSLRHLRKLVLSKQNRGFFLAAWASFLWQFKRLPLARPVALEALYWLNEGGEGFSTWWAKVGTLRVLAEVEMSAGRAASGRTYCNMALDVLSMAPPCGRLSPHSVGHEGGASV